MSSPNAGVYFESDHDVIVTVPHDATRENVIEIAEVCEMLAAGDDKPDSRLLHAIAEELRSFARTSRRYK